MGYGVGARESRRTLLGEIAPHSPNESKREGRGGCLGFLVYLFCAAISIVGGIIELVFSMKIICHGWVGWHLLQTPPPLPEKDKPFQLVFRC